jgi:hypothetical protein
MTRVIQVRGTVLKRFALCALCALVVAPSAASARPLLGINADPLPTAVLAQAARQGVTVARSSVLWSLAQPTPSSAYDWTYTDQMARTLRRLGLRWHAILMDAPAWAGGRGPGVGEVFPDQHHIRAYARFAAAFVRRYHPMYVEVGNEPDGAHMVTGYPTPAQYERIFAAVRRAVKHADRRVLVLNAGIAQQGYADQFYRLAGWRLRDGVNIHTYTCMAGIASWVAYVHQETGYPVVDSEYGWTANGNTPVCAGLGAVAFYAASRMVLRLPALTLAEPFVWASPLVADVAALPHLRS